jgi:transcriptional regulator with XRE-family HTH domain
VRLRRGLFQLEFAGVLGIDIDTLQNWEQGRNGQMRPRSVWSWHSTRRLTWSETRRLNRWPEAEQAQLRELSDSVLCLVLLRLDRSLR